MNTLIRKITLTLISIKKKSKNVMRKLLLILLIFLIIGAVSAHDDLNGTADPLLKDTQYNSVIDDDDEMLVVEQNDYIHNEVNVDKAWSLNVYIDSHDSAINDELVNVTYDQIDVPTSVMIDDEEVPLALGKHNIVYEFKFANTTSIYKPYAYISDSGVVFDFEFIRNIKNPQNSIYRFSSQFEIVNGVEPTSTTFNLGDINITYSDSLSFNLRGISSGEANIYLDETYFSTFEIDESPYEDEIDTTKLAIGSYNLVCIVETDNVYAEYNVNVDASNSMINVNFIKSKTVRSPNRYIIIINATLNVCEFPELNPIYINAPQINITYTRSIPICFEGNDAADLVVYIDGAKVYENSILLSWENTCYIPTKNGDGNYFEKGIHDLSFEFVLQDKYSHFNPEISWYCDALMFDFLDFQESGTYLNDKYIIKTKLNISDEGSQFIPIDSDAVVRIVHTNDINLEIEGLPYSYNLTVFVDDVEIYDGYTNDNTVNIKTFFGRSSIEETNERDIQTGTHSIRFEFKAPYVYDVDAEFRNNALHFKFNQKDSSINPNGVYYQLNTSLIVNEKEKTVHILKVKNNTYFDDTEFVVKMDLYEPEDNDGWDDDEDEDDEDDDEEYAIGTQDVGIIVSNANGIVYIGNDLMNVFEHLQWNYEFENEMLPKAGTYTIKIINLADNTYDTASFEVKKASRTFSKKYSSDDFNVLFTLDFSSCKEDLNDPCHITLNNEEKVINVKKALSKSKKEVLFNDIDPGVYTATFTLEGNEIYNDVTLKSKVTVKKQAPSISYKKSGGKTLELTIDIGQSKTDAVLTVSAGGEQKEFTINKNTKHLSVTFDNLEPGNYDVEIDFKGNERYTSKTLNFPIEITEEPEQTDPEPYNDIEPKGNDLKNNAGGENGAKKGTGTGNGTGTGFGNSNVAGSGNGTYNGKISFNGNGFSGDLGSQGSGNGEGGKSYEITKTLKKIDSNTSTSLIFIIIAVILLILSFIYEKRDDDKSEEY